MPDCFPLLTQQQRDKSVCVCFLFSFCLLNHSVEQPDISGLFFHVSIIKRKKNSIDVSIHSMGYNLLFCFFVDNNLDSCAIKLNLIIDFKVPESPFQFAWDEMQSES